ncbi:MAG: bifunctional riboflavin kinase/FAD synthetase [Lachnospiraceae bacterium]|nr:bifunctional riboflavin kinase/FAD synthetase [Lachnospiraceae bacterium]
MDSIRTEDFSLQNTCVTIGKFDGVHLGHRLLLEKINRKKQETGGKSVVFTFDFHPGMFFGGNGKLIYTEQEKEAILSACGVDVLVAYPFTEKTSEMEAEDFIREILCRQLGASFLAVGEDNRFGHNRRGDAAMLARYGKKLGYGLCVCKKVEFKGESISSTRIRQSILSGDMEAAAGMLGACYHVAGVVKHGKSLGKTLGFPTLNLVPPPEKLLPPNGVYMTKPTLPEGVFNGVTNVGVRPSVGIQSEPWVETSLLGYTANCYGKTAKTEFLHFCRPEQKFGSIEKLCAQIAQDLKECRAYFGCG